MFAKGTIIYFDPFYFKNGNSAKSKYFVVLGSNGVNNIFASLPTRRDSIPAKSTIENGCVELPGISLNCFVISPNQIVTDCEKQFDFTTHLYGHQIDEYDIEFMKENYPNEGIDYYIFGQMRIDIFNDLIKCFKTSKSVRRKYKKKL